MPWYHRARPGPSFSRMQFFGLGLSNPSGPFSVPQDIIVLAQSLAGLKLWDVRYGVALSNTNTVLGWTCAVGGGPTLAASTSNSNPPTFTTNPSLINFNGTTQNLANGATAVSNLNANGTMFMVGEYVDASAGGHNYCYLSDATATQNGYGPASSTTVINAENGIGGTFVSVSSIVNVGTTIITGIVGFNPAGGAGTFSITIPNKAAVTGAPGAGNNTPLFIGVGGGLSGPTTATFANCKVRALGFFPSFYTGGNVTTIQSWANTYHSSVNQ
jgi:hypothetical protein